MIGSEVASTAGAATSAPTASISFASPRLRCRRAWPQPRLLVDRGQCAPIAPSGRVVDEGSLLVRRRSLHRRERLWINELPPGRPMDQGERFRDLLQRRCTLVRTSRSIRDASPATAGTWCKNETSSSTVTASSRRLPSCATRAMVTADTWRCHGRSRASPTSTASPMSRRRQALRSRRRVGRPRSLGPTVAAKRGALLELHHGRDGISSRHIADLNEMQPPTEMPCA